MRHILLIFTLFLMHGMAMQAQLCDPAKGWTCDDARVFCSLDELDGYICRNPPPPNPAGPVPLCPDGGVPNNIHWIAFVAESDSTEIQITIFNCTTVAGQRGFQAGIYTDCNFTEAVACQSNCFTGSTRLAFLSEPCRTYYLFVDGCNGVECDYEIRVLDGKGSRSMVDSLELTIPDTVCFGGDLCMSVNSDSLCASEIFWRIGEDTLSEQTASVCISGLAGGEAIVCVKAIIGSENSVCDSTDWECRTVYIRGIQDTVFFPRETFCWEDRFGLFFQQCAAPVRPIPGLQKVCCSVSDSIGCTVQYCKEYLIRDQPTVGYELVILCEKEPYTLPGGQVVTECGSYYSYFQGGGETGCDTTIEVDLGYLEPRVFLWVGQCLDGKACIKSNVSFDCPFIPQIQIRSHWIERLSGDILAMDTSVLCVAEPGEYCILIQSEYQGALCSPRQYCVTVTDIRPSPPLVNCARVSCPDTIQATADPNGQQVTEYEWTVSDGEIIGANNGATVQLDLTGATPGLIDVCARLVNECGVSDLQCAYVLLLADTLDADFSFQMTGDSVSFLAIAPNANTFEWDFGDGSTGSGWEPEHVYAAPGTYTVRMIASHACATDTVEKEITVMFTGLYDDRSVTRLDIFPNPAEGMVTLRVADAAGVLGMGEYRVRVMTLDGRSWYDSRLTGSFLRDGLSVDLSGVPSGVCYILVEGDGGLFGGRVVLTR